MVDPPRPAHQAASSKWNWSELEVVLLHTKGEWRKGPGVNDFGTMCQYMHRGSVESWSVLLERREPV